MTAVTSQMNRMVLLYTLILSMVSLPTSLPKHLLVETADKGGDDYSNPPSIPPLEFRKKYGTTDSAEQRNNLNMPAASRIKQGEDYGRLSAPRPHPPRPRPSPSPNPWMGGWGRGGSGNIVGR